MVLNRKPKQQRKQRRGTKRFAEGCGVRKSKRTGVLQHGGVSPACVFDGASGADVLYRNTGVNVHNTNPQASLDLDNKFMSYGGAVPLGSNILQGGAAKCGDEGLGGAGNGKNETFKQYLDGLASNYNISGGGNGTGSFTNISNTTSSANSTGLTGVPGTSLGAHTTGYLNTTAINTGINKPPYGSTGSTDSVTTIPPDTSYAGSTGLKGSPDTSLGAHTTGHLNTTAINVSSLTGGGFSTDPSEYIAGLPVYKSYDDCCPPAIVNNQLVMGAPDQPVCGLGAIKGGARRRRKTRASRKRSTRRKNTRRSRRHTQRGGDFVYSATKSTPAPMSDAFNGPQGVFRYPDDMMSRAFDELQPNYSVNAI